MPAARRGRALSISTTVTLTRSTSSRSRPTASRPSSAGPPAPSSTCQSNRATKPPKGSAWYSTTTMRRSRQFPGTRSTTTCRRTTSPGTRAASRSARRHQEQALLLRLLAQSGCLRGAAGRARRATPSRSARGGRMPDDGPEPGESVYVQRFHRRSPCRGVQSLQCRELQQPGEQFGSASFGQSPAPTMPASSSSRSASGSNCSAAVFSAMVAPSSAATMASAMNFPYRWTDQSRCRPRSS